MKVNFPVPDDGKRHRYCSVCHEETIEDVDIEGKRFYRCSSCGQTKERLIDLLPERVWWIDKETKEIWHETVGVIVTDDKNRILLIERTLYPYGFNFPAGHLDNNGEKPKAAAERELFEETGIKCVVKLVAEEDIPDLCRGGADFHRWHLYTCQVPPDIQIKVDAHEGKNPVWLSKKEAVLKNLTSPTRHFLDKYLPY